MLSHICRTYAVASRRSRKVLSLNLITHPRLLRACSIHSSGVVSDMGFKPNSFISSTDFMNVCIGEWSSLNAIEA